VQEETEYKQLDDDEQIVKGVIEQAATAFGISDPRPFKQTRKNGKDLNKTE
jgi:hypothetical protein